MTKNKVYLSVAVIVLSIVVAGFIFADKQVTAPVQEIANTPTTAAPNLVEETQDLSTYDILTPDQDSKLFRGPFTVTGKFNISAADMVSNILCFHVNQQTGKLIHRDKDDQREPWFCFQNNKEAQSILGISKAGKLGDNSCVEIEGEATVSVKNHYYDRREAGVFDLATLVSVNKVITKPYCIPISE